MQCGELMKTDIKVLSAGALVTDAARIMRNNNVGFLPVCDLTNSQVLGIVTDWDIVVRLVAEHRSLETSVLDIASPVTVFCKVDCDVKDAYRVMKEQHIARVLCLDETGRLAGVLNLSDVASRLRGLERKPLPGEQQTRQKRSLIVATGSG
jgi:CBS domain-containing protein